ncbi:hypothetical protein FOA43_003176 [Brettanomyces nanus]|uniref:Interferon-related developmental regulator N-terminal domain-containing protein n=1 Tax=Eeniella nana TaxID=13502 RepID=A0A875S9V9_EENNA|nr:uncharacterized protein FOA43_003176 [Brettanomyces nanus]QPG75814.1 hypothetical protein FOA43_003176 [Brettanomyces nanus]
MNDFSVASVDQLDVTNNPEIQQQLSQDLHDVKILRSPSFGALSREESRNNSVIGSLIDDELDDDNSGNSESRSNSVATNSGIRIYTLADMIEALSKPRSKINTDSRLFLLSLAYKMLIRRPDMANVNEQDMEQLIGYIKTSRSDIEMVLSIKLASAYGATDTDEVGTELMDELIPLLFGKIFDFTNSVFLRSNCIAAYFSLLLVIFDGSDCYSVADNVNGFLELVEGYQSPKNASSESDKDTEFQWDIVAGSINGICVILTLLYKSGKNDINELIQDCLPRLIPFFGSEFPRKVHKALCILIGVMYEAFDYKAEEREEEEEGNDEAGISEGPYYDVEELKMMIGDLSRESTKKVGKKNKREVRSIYRDALRTIEEANKEKDEDEEELDDADIRVISRFSISKNKQVPIRSWFAFVRLIHLKYLFDTELSSHYLYSKEVRELLARPDEQVEYDNDDEEVSGVKHWKGRQDKVSGKKKDSRIQRARDRKLLEKMEGLNI